MTDCGCGGRRKGVEWHRARGEEPCDASREAARRYDRSRQRPKRPKRAWVPGSPIVLPELDPL